MKMQKRIFTTLLSKLISFRLASFLYPISGRTISSIGKCPSRWFHREDKHGNISGCNQTLAQYDLHRDHDFSEEENNEWISTLSHAPRNSILRIGVLDDNPAILSLYETILTRAGHTIAKHTTGLSLLDALLPQKVEDPTPYDLVILDLLLPGTQSGADVFFAIRQQFPAEVLPIIVISAVDEPTLKQFRHILPNDVPLLRKPFPPHMLRQLITQLTQRMDGKA